MSESRFRGIEPQAPTSLSLPSRLAARTLAERAVRAQSRIKVLVVDDIRETGDYLTKILSIESDIEMVGVARTGIEALERARHVNPDVVLMDIMMPEMDGLTATAILLDQLPEITVVMMSVQGDTDYMSRAFRAGARGYLVKPFSLDDLMTAVRDARKASPPWIRGYGHS
jgi:pilus assembly protein CpaE